MSRPRGWRRFSRRWAVKSKPLPKQAVGAAAVALSNEGHLLREIKSLERMVQTQKASVARLEERVAALHRDLEVRTTERDGARREAERSHANWETTDALVKEAVGQREHWHQTADQAAAAHVSAVREHGRWQGIAGVLARLVLNEEIGAARAVARGVMKE